MEEGPARAMEHARVEPLLEGEEIAEAVAEEIRELLTEGPRGETASDLVAGKVVELGGRLLVSPTPLVLAIRRRLVDDVLSRAAIVESAAAHLGMRELRHHFRDGRPHAWAFPVAVVAAFQSRAAGELLLVEGASSRTGEEREGLDESKERVCAGETERIRSTDQAGSRATLLTTERYEADPLDREKKSAIVWSSPVEPDRADRGGFSGHAAPGDARGTNGRRNGGPTS